MSNILDILVLLKKIDHLSFQSILAKTVTDKVADVTDTVNNEASNLDLEDAFEVAGKIQYYKNDSYYCS